MVAATLNGSTSSLPSWYMVRKCVRNQGGRADSPVCLVKVKILKAHREGRGQGRKGRSFRRYVSLVDLSQCVCSPRGRRYRPLASYTQPIAFVPVVLFGLARALSHALRCATALYPGRAWVQCRGCGYRIGSQRCAHLASGPNHGEPRAGDGQSSFHASFVVEAADRARSAANMSRKHRMLK